MKPEYCDHDSNNEDKHLPESDTHRTTSLLRVSKEKKLTLLSLAVGNASAWACYSCMAPFFPKEVSIPPQCCGIKLVCYVYQQNAEIYNSYVTYMIYPVG
jgi:hypothetical protein